MGSTVTGIKGEFRSLTPAEIGDWVRMLREGRVIKRAVLAREAAVSEKTLERLEGGVQVSASAYRQVARALGLSEHALLDERYIPTTEEAVHTLIRQAEAFEATYREVHVERATDARQFVRVLGASLYYVDDSSVAPEHAMKVAEFTANLSDWSDISDDLDAVARLEAGRSLLKEAQSLHALGYHVHVGLHQDIDRPGSSVAVVIIVLSKHRGAGASRVFIPRHQGSAPA